MTDHRPLTSGPPTGEVVILLHGFPQTPAAWRTVAPALAAAGYRVVAPWQRGYRVGERARRDDLRLPRLADDVLALADELGAPRVHVVGHDWGALVGWRLAGDRPDRVATFTALSVPHPRAMIAALPAGQALRSAYVALFRLPVVAEFVLGAGGGRPLHLLLRQDGLTGELADLYVGHLVRHDLLGSALDWYRANGIGELDRVPPVSVPTRFVWGRRDPAIGRAAAEACARFCEGPFQFDELDAGHWLPELWADRVTAAVLAQVSGRAEAGAVPPGGARG